VIFKSWLGLRRYVVADVHIVGLHDLGLSQIVSQGFGWNSAVAM
jgi:hypothetical protein